MKIKKITFVRILRRLIQLAAFALIPGLFITAFSALKDVWQAIVFGGVGITALGYQIVILIAVVGVTMLLGRFFCGYLCAFGALSDFLWFIAGKVHKKRLRIGEKTDKLLKAVKYVIFAFIIVFVWTLGSVSFGATASRGRYSVCMRRSPTGPAQLIC
jgi:polyferredoxin